MFLIISILLLYIFSILKIFSPRKKEPSRRRALLIL